MSHMLTIFRQRLIPDECIRLNDEVIFWDKDTLVTKWKTIRPRPDLDHGCSIYYLKKGYKVSRFYNAQNELIYHYCDIITHTYDEGQNALTVIDLLADVIVGTDNTVRVVDLDEVADALEGNILTLEQCKMAMRSISELLNIIYDGGLGELSRALDNI